AEEPLAEAEGEDEDADAEELRHEEVSRLVKEDQQSEDDDEGDRVALQDALDDGHVFRNQRLSATSIPRASLRAQPSQCNASSTVSIRATLPEWRSSTRLTMSTIPVNRSSPARKRSTAISFAAFSTAGIEPPARQAS